MCANNVFPMGDDKTTVINNKIFCRGIVALGRVGGCSLLTSWKGGRGAFIILNEYIYYTNSIKNRPQALQLLLRMVLHIFYPSSTSHLPSSVINLVLS